LITLDEFKNIDQEVKHAIDEVLNHIKLTSQNYILLLANGEYMSSLNETRLNPYAIDSAEDGYIDRTRREFFSGFMNEAYSFPNGSSINSDSNAIQLELMIYCHIWESKPFLKTLYRLATLTLGRSYPWDVEVPRSGKEDFIRNVIIDTFKNKGLQIGKVMTNGFHSSLRNAFAHSDYYFGYSRKEIKLTNYTGKKWELSSIMFADWRKRFAYSALLSHYLLNNLYERRINVIKEFNRDEFPIIHPIGSNRFKVRYIKYFPETDHFNFLRFR